MRQVQGLPELIVHLAGRRLPAAELVSVSSVQVRTALAQPAQCVITWSLDERASAEPDPGDALRVELGGYRQALFTGEVTVVEHSYGANASRELRVRAYDALHRLRKRQNTRLHHDVSLGGLVTTLVAGTGLSVGGGSQRLGDVYQCSRSDLDLLADVCSRVGVYPVVDDKALRLLTLAGEGDPIDLELGTSLHSADFEVSQEPSFRSAVTTYWNGVTARANSSRAEDSRARASVKADASPERVGGGGALVRADEVMSDDALAAALAQSELDVREAGEVTALLVTDGDPGLRAGRRVQVKGVASALEGVYAITEATHTLDGTGYETVISTRPPAAPAARPRDQVTLGVVADVADPDRRGRARVDLTAYPGLSTGWAPSLVAGAGGDKGAVVLPDQGDTVLVLLPAGDPAQAIIIGGLYGTHQPPDGGVSGPRGGRYTLRTRSGHELCLDDAAHTLSLVDSTGSRIELAPGLMRLVAATDLLIEAPGQALRIRARSIDFEEAP